MRRILIYFLMAAPLAAKEFTLEQAVDSALRQNRDLRAAEIALENSRYGVDAASANFAWAVRPDGQVSASDSTKTTQIGLSAQKNFISGTTISAGPQITSFSGDGIEPQKTALFRVQVEQPLLRRFGELENRENLTRSEHAVLSARRDLELRRNDLVVQVVATHEGLLQLQQKEDYDRQSLQRLEKLYRLTAAREKQGRASRVDSLRADLQRGRAESLLQTTREQLDSSRRNYSDLIGLAPTTDIVAAASARLEIIPPSAETAAAVAWSNRLDYAQVFQDLGDAERGVKIAKRNLLPDVSVIARYDWLGQGKKFGDAINLNDDAWFVGLSAGNSDLLKPANAPRSNRRRPENRVRNCARIPSASRFSGRFKTNFPPTAAHRSRSPSRSGIMRSRRTARDSRDGFTKWIAATISPSAMPRISCNWPRPPCWPHVPTRPSLRIACFAR